jgi:phage protein D
MTVRTLQIASNKFGNYDIMLDDHDISGAIRGIDLTIHVGALPRAELDLLILEVASHRMAADITIPDSTRELLIQLGWTPPEAP